MDQFFKRRIGFALGPKCLSDFTLQTGGSFSLDISRG
jgi:hypothetical protein